MPKGIKKTAKILKNLIAIIIIILAIVPILLYSSKVQNFVAKSVISELSSKINSKISIESIEYVMFNKIKINKLYIEDQQKDSLIYIDELNAHFSLKDLFYGKVLFTTLELNKLRANLKVDNSGHNNIDFLLNAFKKNNKKDSSNVEYKIKSLKLKDSYFSFSKQKAKRPILKDILNPDSLRFSNINVDIALNVLKKDTLNLVLKSLNCEERSGLKIENISTLIAGGKKNAKIPSLNIQLANTNLNINDIELTYDSLSDFKNFTQKIKLKIPIENSSIQLKDLKSIVPQFKNTNHKLEINGNISGRLSNLRFKKMEFKYGKSLYLNADLDISGLPKIEDAFIYSNINNLKIDKSDIQDLISMLTNKPFLLPNELSTLGTVVYKGNITGFLSSLVAYGNLNTNLGSVSTDILLKFENKLKNLRYNGNIKSNNLQLGKLLNDKKLGLISFNLNSNGLKKENSAVQGNVKAIFNEIQYNNYTYKDVKFNGKFDGKGFDGGIVLNDENVNANFKGVIDLTKKLPIYDFDIEVTAMNLNALKLTNKYQGSLLSFYGTTNMIGNSLDNLNGFVLFDNIKFTNKDKTLNVSEIKFVSRTDNNESNFQISSDFVNGSFTGNFKYSTVGKTINKIIEFYLPSLALEKKSKVNSSNHIDIDLSITNTKEISEILELPYKLDGEVVIDGSIDEFRNEIDLACLIPSVNTSKQKIQNIKLNLKNKSQLLSLTSEAHLSDKNGLTNFYCLASVAKDSITGKLGWKSDKNNSDIVEIQTITKFRRDKNRTAAQMKILPTDVIISDSIWKVLPSKIDFNSDSTISISNFRFESKKQFIHIDGKLSKNQEDGVHLTMNELNLDYFLKLIKLKGISIGGIVTGEINLFGVLKEPIFLADLKVKNASLNQKIISNASVNSTWDAKNKQVLLGAKFYDDFNKSIGEANGAFFPKKDSIDVMFDAHGVSVEFLNTYFAGIVDNFKGLGHGKLRMFGPIKTIGFEGNIFVDKGQGSINMLKTTYFFNDSVYLKRKSIELKNLKIYDEEKNQGVLNGKITHDGLFQNMNYSVKIYGKNVIGLNTHAGDNDYFFGKAYATGNVSIYGNDKVANIDVNATSQPKTKCYINMGGASSASDNSFIKFINPKSEVEKTTETPKIEKSKFNVKVDLQIDVTPNAIMELIVDPKGGDIISGVGNGNLRVQFDTFSDIKLYGTYVIDIGYYLFTLQTVIRKEFKIDKGSTLAWTGNPFDAQVNIRALYPLTASLSDLTGESETNKANVPVNCVLKLNDELMKPTIKFEIDLPASDEAQKQKLRNIINTEEMMNKQIASLLVLNTFFLHDATNAGLTQTISFATSTLSSHINNWIQKSLNTKNFSIGLNWNKTQQGQEDEFKANINYQLNKRFKINGDIGYRTDNISSNELSNSIIDFELEYLLTEAGNVSVKGFQHTVDRSQAYLKNTNYTRGVGFVYKEEFETVSEMLKYYWNFITFKNRKNKNNDSVSENE